MSPARPTPDDAPWRRLALVFLGGLLLLRLSTFLDYGLTWDEELERRNAARTIRWYASGFTDTRLFDEGDQYLYGALFNVMVWLAARVSPLGYYETGHLLVALMGLLATLAAYMMAEQVAGPRAGLLAALSLSLTPVFYGHSFNNPKDVPFAALFALGLALLLRTDEALPRVAPRRALALGACIGLAAGIRMVGLSLLAALAALASWRLLRTGRGAAGAQPGGAARRLLVSLGLVALAAVVVMLPSWPYLQLSPLGHGVELLRSVARFDWPRTVLFEGRQVQARELPRSYLPVWLLISLPEFQLLALAAGAGLAVRTRVAAEDAAPAGRSVKAALVLASVVAPIGAVVVLRPVIYDGLRQFLFVVPSLACLVGLGLEALLRVRPRGLRLSALALAAGSMALTVADMARLHPYQSAYFNRAFGGGLGRASTRFETDYWGSCYKEAVEWLIAEHRPARAARVRVANVSNHFLTAYYLDGSSEARARFEAVRQPRRADIVLATTRWNEHRAWPGRVLHVVTREGVGLCYVIERSGS